MEQGELVSRHLLLEHKPCCQLWGSFVWNLDNHVFRAQVLDYTSNPSYLIEPMIHVLCLVSSGYPPDNQDLLKRNLLESCLDIWVKSSSNVQIYFWDSLFRRVKKLQWNHFLVVHGLYSFLASTYLSNYQGPFGS